ncbi:hypothetical protein [Butyribacter intestini]|uniref:Glycosyltransferase RgtA/B/C/D-like domain-containing protein n=1 Tax=Butyribacter intestini TaxID=1703332 RepID=A0AAW3JSL0_9FIRM|nr:hypothetical protein [Butyribacter intestini]KQC85862.1 hypothetical protein APZ18_01275 [Butyribacter intestini]RHU76961.1 hypothetical protein DXC30_01305 [Butyribacter intestini]
MSEGSIGNITAVLYYMFFVISGIIIMFRLLNSQKLSIMFKCLLGSVFGTLEFQWMPIIFAFFMDFTVEAHICALVIQVLVFILVILKTNGGHGFVNTYKKPMEWKRFLCENPASIIIFASFVIFAYCLNTHTILLNSDGSLHTGQATYSDMNMHIGFITSIAKQHTFPPEYSIYPGVKLAYPFLSDSISSSLYLLGASLRVAYIIPMLVAVMQVFGGFYCFIKFWFKKGSVAFVAFILFFYDGGFGFIHFLNKVNFSKNFTEFYFTPTSIGDYNYRWAQIIANMLIPQRATLFGWAVLFPLLAFLYYAKENRSIKSFLIAGIMAAGLPMIHTHSFLALGIICVVWLFWDMYKEKESYLLLKLAGIIWVVFFFLLRIYNDKTGLIEKNGFIIMIAGLGIIAVLFVKEIVLCFKNSTIKSYIQTWGVFLIPVILFALPQLLFWTFGQASGDGFLRSHFNWSNANDNYFIFYLKNIGITFLIFFPAWVSAKKKELQTASPMLLIFFIAELVVFQPNEYDNNKLLFVAFVFMCGIVSDFVIKLFEKNWNIILKCALAVSLLFVGVFSSGMTIARECVSDYELYSKAQVDATEYIEKNTDERAVFLTGDNHNNAVAALTGRSIVCGADTFLCYHGINTVERKSEVANMYADPVGNKELYKKYNVSYIFVSDVETDEFQINFEGLGQIAEKVYDAQNVVIYKCNEL